MLTGDIFTTFGNEIPVLPMRNVDTSELFALMLLVQLFTPRTVFSYYIIYSIIYLIVNL